MNHRSLVLILLFFPLLGYTQKIKYKDLFPKLNAQDYETSVGDLRTFLSDSKNDDHANGHLQYALYFEWRFMNSDVLDDSTQVLQAADSAVLLFKKTRPMITEKELKKQDEYYQNFFRRDLRTGEFGIKVSDVHLDIDKKIEVIEARKAQFQNLHNNLRIINNKYGSSSKLYLQLTKVAEDYRQLLLKLDEGTLFVLETLLSNSAGLYPLIDEVRKTAREMEIEKYTQAEAFKAIENFPTDGIEQTDVYAGQLDLWDYDKWASTTKDDHLGLQTFRKKILALEKQVFTAKQAIENGQGAPAINWKPFIAEDMAFYDPNAPSVRLLRAKIFELEVKKFEMLMNDSTSADSANVVARLDMVEGLAVNLDSMDNLMQTVKQPEADLMKVHYSELVDNIYGGPDGLDGYVKDVEAGIHARRENWDAKYEELQSRAKLAIGESDTVLLESGQLGSRKTLGGTGKETRIAFGIDSEDQKGFVAWSGPDRTLLNIESFELGDVNLMAHKVDTMPTPNLGFYLFDPNANPEETKNLVLVLADGRGGIKWSNVLSSKREPENFRYDATLDQVTVFFYPEDALPEGEDEVGYIVIDRNGTVR